MQRKNALLVVAVLLCTAAFLTGVASAGGQMTITGTVNQDHQIVTDDGKAYDVAQSEEGKKVSELVGKKVKVMGSVKESEGKMVINVTGYELLMEPEIPKE
ncbi:MAG: hypothetical protein HWN68_18830 [Desulfobacterales bacterium]|nr:hypothetical protein [Desulfobacterales bacterium]